MASSFEGNVGPSIGKVANVEKGLVLSARDEQFNNVRFEELLQKERPKTRDELQLIALANEVTDALRNLDGLSDCEIPSHKIHIVKEHDWPESEKGNAFYDSECQAIAIREQEANIVFFKKVVHEMIHFKSYRAVQMAASANPEIREYRMGLIVHDRDGHAEYFRGLNEAVTEEITKEIVQTTQHSLLQRDLAQTKELASRYSQATTATGERFFDEDTFYACLDDETIWQDRLGKIVGRQRSRAIAGEQFGYAQERNILHHLIQKLFLRNREQFQNVSQINEIFRRGMMTGNILPLGKLIETTFGKGTLRKIGDLDPNPRALERFVGSL